MAVMAIASKHLGCGLREAELDQAHEAVRDRKRAQKLRMACTKAQHAESRPRDLKTGETTTEKPSETMKEGHAAAGSEDKARSGQKDNLLANFDASGPTDL
jgi:hypothetical protein